MSYDESPDSPDNACTGANRINNSCPVAPDTSTSLVSEIPDTRAVISDVPAPLAPAEIPVTNTANTVTDMPMTLTKDPLISAALSLVDTEQVSEETKMKLEEMRIRAGNDPETAEMEQLTLPGQTVVNADLHHLRRRNVFASPLTMVEFSHPHVLEVMAHCEEFKVSFLQQPEAIASQSCWEGCMTFRMRTLSDAKEAVLHLQDIRSDLNVRLLKINENVYDVMERWQRMATTSSDESSKETDRLLVVNNLPAGVTETKLQHLFPDALEIVVVATKNQSGKCSAYLMFSGKVQIEEAYKKYTSKNIYYDGQLLRIHKYMSPKTIPEDFLQLGERFRVLSLLERFVTTYKASSALCISMQIQQKMREAITYLLSLANLDAIVRQSIGLPAFTLEELHLLLDMPRSLGGGGVLPVTELLSVFSTEQDRLKDSKTARKCCGTTGEQGMMRSDNSDSDSERKDRTTLKAIDGPHTRSQLRKSFENMVHSRMHDSRLPSSPRRTTPFSSGNAQKRSALKPLAPSKRPKFSGSYSRDEHSRYQTTASRSYSSYRRTVHLWSTGSHRISRYCTKIQPRDQHVRGSRVLHSSHHRH